MMTVYTQGYDLRGALAGFIPGKPAFISEDCARWSMGMCLFFLIVDQICLKRRCPLAHIMYKRD